MTSVAAQARPGQGGEIPQAALMEIQQAQEIRQRAAQFQQQLDTLSAELADHTRVIDVLKGLDPKRTCFRRVGELLVERTVEQVVPELEANVSKIVQACKKMDEQKKLLDKEANEILLKHNDSLEELGRRRAMQDQL